MSIKPDKWIAQMAREQGMIEPFTEGLVREGKISYGLSSYGYDVRVADEFKIFTPNPYNTIVDPKDFDGRAFVSYQGNECIIPPNSFALARTVEYFRMPRNVTGLVLGKSTYARCGIVTNFTPLERDGKGTSPSRSATLPRCRPRSTPTKGSPRCSSWRATWIVG